MTLPRVAKVIVDVPARETDRPFDYLLTEATAEWVRPGSRVEVRFAGRTLQGIVVGLSAESDVEEGKLKPLESVLDAEPPLTGELLQLSEWVSDKYACSRIAAIQAMLPSALKAQYGAMLTAPEREGAAIAGSQEEEALLAYIRSRQPVSLDQVLKAYPGCSQLLKRCLSEGSLLLRRTVKDRLSRKTALAVYPQADGVALLAEADKLPARSVKQKELLRALAESKGPIPLAELSARLGGSVSGAAKALEGRGLVSVREEEVLRDPYAGRSFTPSEPLPLTAQQQAAYSRIVSAVRSRSPDTFLLQGVTGSGKTEVYLQSIQACLEEGRDAIVLVPEISLTPQMVERFKSRFGELVAVLHSRLSDGERYDEWRKIADGKARVAVGARSAVFAPFSNLGLIIIDEEHESSYKQEESPKYHARDTAIERGRLSGAPVVLGSATPSLETYVSAVEGRYQRLQLTERALGGAMPAVTIVDMREQLKGGNRSMFSAPLFEGLQKRLERGEQSVLLLNRRGYSTFVMCRSCGYTAGCPHCDISLTYHQHTRLLRCHYCGYSQAQPETCPECGSPHIRYFGTGTQKVEEELARLFPGIRVIRMDVDTTTEKGSHEKWLTMFREHKADVLLGTQMVAKGLDFPLVTLVGVIAADTVLHLPDFRAAEKTFQLLTQVAGRAGRHQLPGEVVIQTYSPEHYSVQTASQHDYEAFVQQERRQRQQLGYPPYCRLICITLSDPNLQAVVRAGEALADSLRRSWRIRSGESRHDWAQANPFDREQEAAEVLGPVAAPIPRIKDRYRFHCVVKASTADFDGIIASVKREADRLAAAAKRSELLLSIDVDPQVMM